MCKRAIILGMAMACAVAAHAANFKNLDFEYYAPDSGGWAVVPGWGSLDLDPITMAGASFGLVTINNEYMNPLEGEASLFVGTGDIMYQHPIFIEQIGDVPTNATDIRFLTTLQGAEVTLGGASLTVTVPEEYQPGIYRYTTDISPQAGQTATLKIEIHDSPWEWHQLDQIEFLDGGGTVIWPPPGYSPPICLEDFHASTLNTSLWEVVAVGQTISNYIAFGQLRTDIPSAAAPFETVFRYRSLIRGDWDVRMDFLFIGLPSSIGTGVFGMALGADFGQAGTAKACVGQMVTVSNHNDQFYGMDWGQGPTDTVATTSVTGVFRLVHTGWEVAGYIWDAGSNDWRMVGTADGYTDETARVGLKVWSTGAFGGKGSQTHSDNLMLGKGQASLEGMAIKVFGLNGSGAPSVTWNSAGIPETNRYFVTRSTNLLDPVWKSVSGALGESAESNHWTGSSSGAGPTYYRIEVAPGN